MLRHSSSAREQCLFQAVQRRYCRSDQWDATAPSLATTVITHTPTLHRTQANRYGFSSPPNIMLVTDSWTVMETRKDCCAAALLLIPNMRTHALAGWRPILPALFLSKQQPGSQSSPTLLSAVLVLACNSVAQRIQFSLCISLCRHRSAAQDGPYGDRKSVV